MNLLLKSFVCLCLCLSSLCYSNETVLLLIRHGQTDWNIDDRAQGHTNNPLNEKGLAQAQDLAKKLASNHSDIAAIYSSDLDRALTTAQFAAEKLHLKVKKNARLRERNNGASEGLTWEEEKASFGHSEELLNQLYPYYRERWCHTSIPGAETYQELLERMENALKEIASQHKGEKIAVFAHGEIIGIFISNLTANEKPFHLPNCSITHITYAPNDIEKPFRLISTNE